MRQNRTHHPGRGALALGMAGALCCACSKPHPADDSPDLGTAPQLACSEAPLPLQNARAFTLGETFYLPAAKAGPGCPSTLAWEVAAAPSGSRNRVYNQGAPQPRFTPDLAGDYVLRLKDVPGSDVALRAVSRTPAERFRNHYLPPAFGAALIGDELWTANGPSYTVTRLSKDTAADGTVTWRKQGEVTAGSWPAAVVGRADLPYALVAQRGGDTVAFIDRQRGVLEDALWVGDEPTGMALSPDGKRLYVSLATERAVAVVDLTQRALLPRLRVGFDPRALALSADGKRLYVASYRSANLQAGPMGSRKVEDDQDVWIVNTDTGAIDKTVYTVAADLRALALSSDGAELYVAASDGDTIPAQNDPMAVPFTHQVVVIGARPDAAGYGTVLRRADLTRQASAQGRPFVNPAGILATADTLWVSAEASAQVAALDPRTLAERLRVDVGPGARHLIPLDAQGTVAVHCFEDLTLRIIGKDGKVRQSVALASDPRPADVIAGERIFTRPGGAYGSNYSCTGCHPETQSDTMVWRTGARLWEHVRPLQLMAATTPLGWDAYGTNVGNFSLAGPVSNVGRPTTTEEARALTAFMGSLIGAPRANGATRLDGSYSAAGLRGKALFEGLSCVGCHAPPLYTNRRLIPTGKSGTSADVPSLLGVYRHGVYLVKAQARSLDAALDVALTYVNATVTPAQRQDLLAFLNELTPKGAAPLGVWPDRDSAAGVGVDVQPWISFADPVDDAQPGVSAAQEAAAHVLLVDEAGAPVAGQVQVSGFRLTFVPQRALSPGKRYTLRVTPGLRFQSGGVLEAEYASGFQTSAGASAALPGAMLLTIQLPPMGPMPPPPLKLNLDLQPAAAGAGQVLLTLDASRQQRLWVLIDGDSVYLDGFAVPIGMALADGGQVQGTIKATRDEGGKKVATLIEGKLRVRAPGISVPDVPFTITPR